jgi:hypothetical protein
MKYEFMWTSPTKQDHCIILKLCNPNDTTKKAHSTSGLTPSLAPRPLWPQAYFDPRHISAQGILRPNASFGPEILWPETTSTQYTSARGPNFQLPICHCCCMLDISRLENVPRLKMLFYKA